MARRETRRWAAALGLGLLLESGLAGCGGSSAKPVDDTGIEWNPDAVARLPGPIAFEAGRQGNVDIYLFDPATRATRRLTDDPADDRYPAFAPDGRSIYYVHGPEGSRSIFRVDLASGAREPVIAEGPDPRDPVLTPDGGILIHTRGAEDQSSEILAQALAGGSETVLVGSSQGRSAHAAVTRDGRSVAYTGGDSHGWQVHVLDLASGQSRRLTDDPSACRPDASPVADLLAFVTVRWDGRGDIAVMGLDGQNVRRITPTDTVDYYPAWSKDGRFIAFATAPAKDSGPDGSTPWHLALAAADGSTVDWLTRSDGYETEPTFEPAPAGALGAAPPR